MASPTTDVEAIAHWLQQHGLVQDPPALHTKEDLHLLLMDGVLLSQLLSRYCSEGLQPTPPKFKFHACLNLRRCIQVCATPDPLFILSPEIRVGLRPMAATRLRSS